MEPFSEKGVVPYVTYTKSLVVLVKSSQDRKESRVPALSLSWGEFVTVNQREGGLAQTSLSSRLCRTGHPAGKKEKKEKDSS